MGREQAYDYRPERIDELRRSYRRGGPLQRELYLSDEVLNADLDRIWRRHWLYAGHACMVEKPGDWMTWSIGRDQVVIVRAQDGALRAFHNVCRHRGARICNAAAGSSRLLVCPYHAWTYELDGRLRTRTKEEFGIEPEKLGLLPVAIENIAGVLFVALSDDAIPFDRARAELAAELPHQGFDEAKIAASKRYRVKANWKLVFENNRECYHCAHAHPEYIKGTYDIARFEPGGAEEADRQTALADARFKALGLGGAIASSAMTGAWWRVTRAPLMDGWDTETLDGTPAAPLMGTFRARNERSKGTLRTTIFPNFWQHANDDHAVATRLTPIDATTTEVDVHWIVHRDAVEGKDYTLAHLMPFWQRTSEQDWVICEANQIGVSSPAYRPGPYARMKEANVQHFVDWYIDALGDYGKAPAATGPRLVSGGTHG